MGAKHFKRTKMSQMDQKSKQKKGNVYEILGVRGAAETMTFAVVGVAKIMDTGGVNKWITTDCNKSTRMLVGLDFEPSDLL